MLNSLEKLRRNQAGALTHIYLPVPRMISFDIIFGYALISSLTSYNWMSDCTQICRDHGTRVFARRLAVCLAYDSGIKDFAYSFKALTGPQLFSHPIA